MKIENKITGEKIAIRSYEKADLPFVTGMWYDKENGRYMSDPENGYIDERYQRAIDNMADNALGYYFVVESLETGALIGSCCAFPNSDSPEGLTFDIGYCVHKSHWRQGCGSEIVSLLLGWIRSMGGVCVTAEVAKENAASLGLLNKFEFEIIREGSFKKYNMDICFDSYILSKKLSSQR